MAGPVPRLTTRFVPTYFLLYAVGVVGIVAWVICLRETTLVGHDEEAPEEVLSDEATEEDEKNTNTEE